MTEMDFFNLCENHDWHYAFSDDHRAYKAGEAKLLALHAALKRHPEYRPIFEGWFKYIFHGAPTPAPCCFLVYQAV